MQTPGEIVQSSLLTVALLMTSNVAQADGGWSFDRIETPGFGTCDDFEFIAASPGEDGNVYAIRIPVGGEAPYVLRWITYGLSDQDDVGGSGWNCDASLAHQLSVWIEDPDVPDATPDVLFTRTVQRQPWGLRTRVPVRVPNIVVQPGQNIYVGITMVEDFPSSADFLCVLMCNETNAPTDGVHFWSQAAQTPYSWVDVKAFGFPTDPGPWVRTWGFRLGDDD